MSPSSLLPVSIIDSLKTFYLLNYIVLFYHTFLTRTTQLILTLITHPLTRTYGKQLPVLTRITQPYSHVLKICQSDAFHTSILMQFQCHLLTIVLHFVSSYINKDPFFSHWLQKTYKEIIKCVNYAQKKCVLCTHSREARLRSNNYLIRASAHL